MLSPNAILQNRYRIIRELGHGGMGTVYEVIDQRVNCAVALKETFAARDSEARKAFEREAELLANLRHQALPKVMDYFSENEGDFLVMEFIAGHDLAELLASRGSPFPQSQVLGWADELLKLLEYLHTRQPPILHRDIKPANLKLTDQGEIFLLDFGLAKGSTGQMPTLVESRSVFGYTPSYASLEQILGQGTDRRSDLYSLGATLYHLLAGVPPTDAPTRFNAIEDEQPDPLQSIERVNPQASSGVTAVIHQAMAIERKQRPDSAFAMRKALRDGAEEDEHHGADEEYRRAEDGRRERDEEGRQHASLPPTVLDPPGPTIPDGHAMPPTERAISAGPQIEMVFVLAGTFTMGSPQHEEGRCFNEGPQKQVSVPSFYMGKYEVTQAQYQAVMGTHSSYFKGDNCPGESVTWNDAVEFCRRLSQMTMNEYRLPSEAEWEYACRAGTETPFSFGSSLSSEQANFDGNHPYGGAANGVFRKRLRPSGVFSRTRLGYTTCMATCGSGVRIGITRLTMPLPLTAVRGWAVQIRNTG